MKSSAQMLPGPPLGLLMSSLASTPSIGSARQPEPLEDDLPFTDRWTLMEPAQRRDYIRALAEAMLERWGIGTYTDYPLEHHFIPGGYARRLTMPAGDIFMGRVHKNACFNFIERGRVTIFSDEGVREVRAPAFFPSPAGAQRWGYIHEKTIWTTVHPTKETDPAKIMDVLTFASRDEFQRALVGPAA